MPKHHLRPQLAAVAVGTVLLALVGVGTFAVGHGRRGRARQIRCGETITTDTTLDNDLVNCPNNGIIIAADDVTLDLNGHTIDGDGTEFADCPKNTFCDVGVAEDRHDGIIVKHGSVREFEFGLNVGRSDHLRALGISTARNRFAGFLFVRCDRSLVRNSAGNRSKGDGDQVGMLLFDSHHDRILHSSFRGNAGQGVMAVKSTKTVIRGNLMSGNGGEGFIMEGGDGFRLQGNRIIRNGGGITLGPGSDNVITRNRVFRGGDGIRIEKGHGNLVSDNVVIHTRRKGIRLGIEHFHSGGAHNVVRRNRVRDSRGDGFAVSEKERHSLLKRNVAKGAKDDGFDIKSRSAKLTKNRALRNGDLGIRAVRGVKDGGGNRARGNGDRRQCVNVVCR